MLWTITEILFWCLVVLGILVLADFLAGRWFFVERFPDEMHFARTDDGWQIAVTRYRPARPNGAEPVLLCHGFGTNRLSLDLTDELSLARALAAAGFDTWIVELRGRGWSTRPRLFSKFRYDWSFDEYAEKDAPAAIDAVLAATRRERLHWVGVSLGAMVGYALLGDERQARKVRSAVLMGGPGTFAFQRKYLFSWPIRNLRWLRHRFLMRLLAPLAGYWRPRLFHSPANIEGDVIRRFMVNCAENFSRNEMLQYSDWIGNDVFRSIDHRRDYRKELGEVRTPMLFVAGAQDLLAPPSSVKDAFNAVGSSDKKFVIASRAQSFKENYGHLDLVLGRHSAAEVYPVVSQWLDAHAEPAAAPSTMAASGP